MRFRFSAEDFASRVGAAAVRLGLLTPGRLGPAESWRTSSRWPRTGASRGPRARSPRTSSAHRDVAGRRATDDLVHWLRRLVFRGAWIDQQVADGARSTRCSTRSTGSAIRSAATGQPRRRRGAVPDWSAFAYGRAAA